MGADLDGADLADQLAEAIGRRLDQACQAFRVLAGHVNDDAIEDMRHSFLVQANAYFDENVAIGKLARK